MDVKLLILCGAAVMVLLLATSCAAPNAGGAPAGELAGGSHAGVQFVDCDGASHELNGKAATFVFWQPWCTACREEAPAAVAASEELVDTMAFYGVVSGPDGSVDEDLMDKSIDELGLSYPQVRDRDLALANRFGITKTPTIIVVGADGKLRYKGSHMPSDWASLR